jgi:hypothetical protein
MFRLKGDSYQWITNGLRLFQSDFIAFWSERWGLTSRERQLVESNGLTETTTYAEVVAID